MFSFTLEIHFQFLILISQIKRFGKRALDKGKCVIFMFYPTISNPEITTPLLKNTTFRWPFSLKFRISDKKYLFEN